MTLLRLDFRPLILSHLALLQLVTHIPRTYTNESFRGNPHATKCVIQCFN